LFTHRDEITAIWNECFSEAGGIQNVLLNLSSESSDELIKKIHEAANSLENNKISTSLINFLKFLSQSDSIKNVMDDQSLENIFNVCCERKTEKLQSILSKCSHQCCRIPKIKG
jgi:hypothetical protein